MVKIMIQVHMPSRPAIESSNNIKSGEQLGLFEDESWKEEDNDDTCVPF